MPEVYLQSASTHASLCCPTCKSGLYPGNGKGNVLNCRHCGNQYRRTDGYWDLLTESRKEKVKLFSRIYSTLRQKEGWSKREAAFYKSLPFRDRTGNYRNIWKQRKVSWKKFVKRVLARMEVRRQRPLNIMDAGAGNGWASNRIAERDHQVWAVDINTGGSEGLRAHQYYDTSFQSVQAAFDDLPFGEFTFDIVLFNASLHYATNLRSTLREALRVLRYGGEIVVMDTPFYSDSETGREMVHEKINYMDRQIGYTASIQHMAHYLTYDKTQQLADDLNLQLKYFILSLPVSEKIRRLWRRIRGSRREAEMPVTVLHRRWPVQNDKTYQTNPLRDYKILKVGWLLSLRLYIRLVNRFFYNRPTVEKIAGLKVKVDRNVFNPRMLRSGKFLANQLKRHNGWMRSTDRVLDLGTGSGVGALIAAEFVETVIATDINPDAVECARKNATQQGLTETITVRQGDLFEPVQGESFDIILFNPPYYLGKPSDKLDMAWRSENIAERFSRQVRSHLSNGGKILMTLSDHGEPEEFLWKLYERGFSIEAVAHRDYINEILTLYEIISRES